MSQVSGARGRERYSEPDTIADMGLLGRGGFQVKAHSTTYEGRSQDDPVE